MNLLTDPRNIPSCTIFQYLYLTTGVARYRYYIGGILLTIMQPLYHNLNTCKKMRVSPEVWNLLLAYR